MNKKKRPPWLTNSIGIYHDCRDGDVIVCYPKKPTEFEVQADLYYGLRHLCSNLDNGTEVKSEVTVICEGNISRFDLMIFKWNGTEARAVCAIEVKRSNENNNPEHHRKQQIKYSQFKRIMQIPVIYCIGMEDVRRAIDEVAKEIT